MLRHEWIRRSGALSLTPSLCLETAQLFVFRGDFRALNRVRSLTTRQDGSMYNWILFVPYLNLDICLVCLPST